MTIFLGMATLVEKQGVYSLASTAIVGISLSIDPMTITNPMMVIAIQINIEGMMDCYFLQV